jgi:predicted  nucleic acid-binding Zn-ribbon protein
MSRCEAKWPTESSTLACVAPPGHTGLHKWVREPIRTSPLTPDNAKPRKTRKELKAEIQALNDRVSRLESEVERISRRASVCLQEMEALQQRVTQARQRITGAN